MLTTYVFLDQMGVELGKVLAKNILSQLGSPADVKGHDSSVCILFVILNLRIADYCRGRRRV